MALPARVVNPEDLDDLDEPAPETDTPEREDSGLDVELETFDEPDPLEIDTPLEIEDEALTDLEDGDDDGPPILLPEETIELLDLPEGAVDDPKAGVSGFDDEDDLLGDERSIDDGGEEGFDDDEDQLDELAADAQIEPDGPDGLDVSSSEALPPWAEVVAVRADPASFDLRFDPNPAPTQRHELAVGSDVDGTRLAVVDDEEGAKFFRGDVLVSDLVPELPLSGIAILGERPIYWVEGEGLFEDQVYIPGTQGLCALAASANGLVLALSARGEHVLALWRDGAMPERIADLHAAPEQLQVRGTTVAVSGAAGLEVFTLPLV